MKPKEVRTRFAPSPTGNLHIGSARTALFNYLFAKQQKGKFILRIEDTDKERSKKKFEQDIVENLKWLGLDEDEFYRQSERLNIYESYIKKLLEENKAYYCFCSKEELEAMRQEQMSRGEAPKYNGKCSKLSEKEVEKRLANREKSVIRFKMPQKKVKFNDLIRGQVEFDSGLIGDIVIAKDLKTPLYNFAVIIDDFEMKITYIIRGEDLLPNTPKQIIMREALGFNEVEYAHLPLILGPDKSKLSKRHGATSLKEYAKEGYLPETIINFLAFLGWNPGDEREIFSLTSLEKEFSLEKIQKSGAVFNIKRLEYLNGFYIRHKPLEELTQLCLAYLPKGDVGYINGIVFAYQERLKKLSEITELTDFFFKDKLDYEKDLLKWKDMNDNDVKLSIDKSIDILSKINEADWKREKIEKELLKEAENSPASGRGRGELLWPLRVALTGKKTSAPPFEIAEILGKEKTLKRLKEVKI